MSQGKRPGGLTALAVLNFVFGGLAPISAFGLIFLMTVSGKLLEEMEKADPQTKELVESFRDNAGIVWAIVALTLLSAVLLIASGVGYLKQKKFLGRTLGNGYAVVDLITQGISLSLVPFGIGNIIGVIYPLVTLFMLNVTFKDDLVN